MEEWIPSSCSMCYAQCSISARVKDGVLVKIEGNPESPVGSGRLCPKGVSGIMTEYDPHRLTVPKKRTNPEKGPGVDPQWVDITWDEALQTIADRLRTVRADDPRKLVYQRTTTSPNTANYGNWWAAAFGTPNEWAAGGGLHCGNGAHQIAGTFHAAWSVVPDFDRCQFAIYFGASKGHSAGHAANSNALKAADARARGMKLVVVDPLCNFAAGKATEWLPIRVGTDAALALAMVNVLLNELDLYDREHIRDKTNGPYLIGPDGRYLREPGSGKPLCWDSAAGAAKPYDDPAAGEFAITGEYEVDGVACAPAFQRIQDHVRAYSPEHAESITTVPARQIRRLAREWGTAAQIGTTVEIDGKRLPYRPVAAVFFRGLQGHRNSVYNCLAVELLNQVVGASDVPGGALGFCPAMEGHPETGKPHFWPYPGPDGLMVPGIWLGMHKPYPPSDVPERAETLTLRDVFPLTMYTPFLVAGDQEEMWERFGVGYRPEMLVNFGANPVLGVGNPETVAAAVRKIPFVVSFDIFLTEFSELADIVLPDTTYLERLDPAITFPPIRNHPSGQGKWCWAIRQPVVGPPGECRHFAEVLLDLAERAGFLADYLALLSSTFGLNSTPYALDPSERYSWDELCDRRLKATFGNAHGLDWFREHGVMTWPKKVEEVYFLPFSDVRLPIYYEFLKSIGEQQRALCERIGFADRIDWSRYEPLPRWTPCRSHQEADAEYDLFGIYYRDVLHTNSFTYENPWLDEIARMNPYSYYAIINSRTAKAKGLSSGDQVVISTKAGRRVTGRVVVSELIHPEAIAVGGCGGHMTGQQPVARGKGIRFAELLEIDFDHCDPVNLNLDLCVKVKVTRA